MTIKKYKKKKIRTMDKTKLEEKIQKLATRVQLEIKKEEMPIYLETLVRLEQLLGNFQKVKLAKKTKPMVRIETGFLTMNDLKKLAKKFSNSKLVQSQSYS